jgi:hypothetical protein
MRTFQHVRLTLLYRVHYFFENIFGGVFVVNLHWFFKPYG